MTLTPIQDGLPALLTRLLDCPTQWRGLPQKMIAGASATIDELSAVGIGADERRSTDLNASGEPAGPEEAVEAVGETVFGLRERVFQVTVWTPSQLLEETSLFRLDRLRTRLRWTSSVAALDAMGLALVSIGPTTALNPSQDTRVRSQASMDLRLSCGVAETDAPTPFIEHARVSTRTRDAGDQPLPAALEVDTATET